MHGGLHALTTARPQLMTVRTAAQALGLRPHELLHAGPPLADPCRPPLTLASSIVMTCVHEGWATDEAAAEALLRRGALRLSPAQDRGCVTPLAAVVAAGTPLLEVEDAQGGSARTWAPLSAVRGADTRMGCRSPGLLDRLKNRDTVVAPALQQALAAHGPLPLWPLALQGLLAGDDLHASTAHANQALVAALSARGAGALAEDIAATPLFFLTLWMAASAWLLRVAEAGGPPGLITRGGGNGERFAIALAGRPGQWFNVPATPPLGPCLPGVADSVPIEGAIGDSAVIDLLGLGGQRLVAGTPEAIDLCSPHPLLPEGWRLGMDAHRVLAQARSPQVRLAMLARDGRGGLCGRGVYRPPLALFEQAVHGLA